MLIFKFFFFFSCRRLWTVGYWRGINLLLLLLLLSIKWNNTKTENSAIKRHPSQWKNSSTQGFEEIGHQLPRMSFLKKQAINTQTVQEGCKGIEQFFFRFLYSVFCSRYFFISLIVLKWYCELFFLFFFSFESPRKLREA